MAGFKPQMVLKTEEKKIMHFHTIPINTQTVKEVKERQLSMLFSYDA